MTTKSDEPSDVAARATPRRRLTALRLLLPYFRPYRPLLIGWLGFLMLSSAATLSLPVAVRLMIDRGFAHTDPVTLNASFIGLFVVAAVLAITTAARYFCISVLGERVVADLRRRLYAHLLTLDMAFYERTRVGELMSRLGADTEIVQTVVSSSISVALRSMVTALGGAVMLVATSPRLAGYAALVIPLVILPIVLAGRRQQKLARANQDRVADASAIANETLNAMYAVQAYAREPVETARYDTAIARALATARRRIAQLQESLRAAILVILEFIVGFCGLGAIRRNVLIEQHRNAAGVKIAAARDVRCLEMMMTQRTVGNFFWRPMFNQFDITNPRRRSQVIHDRIRFIESFRGEDVLVSDTLVLVAWPRTVAMKPNVMLLRHLPEFLIIRHVVLSLEVASKVLLFFQGFKERLEVSFPETLRAFALNDLEEEGRAILHRLGKNL